MHAYPTSCAGMPTRTWALTGTRPHAHTRARARRARSARLPGPLHAFVSDIPHPFRANSPAQPTRLRARRPPRLLRLRHLRAQDVEHRRDALGDGVRPRLRLVRGAAGADRGVGRGAARVWRRERPRPVLLARDAALL
eukprot:4932986-Pleurochrysis_carterae.AAC.1